MKNVDEFGGNCLCAEWLPSEESTIEFFKYEAPLLNSKEIGFALNLQACFQGLDWRLRIYISVFYEVFML